MDRSPRCIGRLAATVVTVVALIAGTGTPAHATDGDQFFHVDLSTGHTLFAECRWNGAASDRGTDAVLHGIAQADPTAVGTTIECWLRYATNKTRIADTTTRAGMPGPTAVTARRIVVPPNTWTKVCAFAQALFADGTSKTYRTPAC